MKPFSHTFRVRYAEVDPQSVVFNSRYLEYADLLVSEFFREAREERGMPADVEFHVRRAEVDYLAPIRLDELSEGARRAETRLRTVHGDLPEGRPTPVPDAVRTAFGFPAREKIDG